MIENHILEQLVEQSAWCQRNWDLSKSIPERDIKTLKYAVTHCPSKQNRVFYKPIFIQDRKTIEDIYETTDSFSVRWDPHLGIHNPQVLANLLVVFLADRDYNEKPRTEPEFELGVKDGRDNNINSIARDDENKAYGVAVGYLTFIANILGYRTGIYNAQRRQDEVKSILATDKDPIGMVGVGFQDRSKDIRQHHLDEIEVEGKIVKEAKFPSFEKNIQVEDI
tara:strand:+ start:348 stop:1016 length:669 start_codon:yes stop_codon:yes gene_type:complete